MCVCMKGMSTPMHASLSLPPRPSLSLPRCDAKSSKDKKTDGKEGKRGRGVMKIRLLGGKGVRGKERARDSGR